MDPLPEKMVADLAACGPASCLSIDKTWKQSITGVAIRKSALLTLRIIRTAIRV